MKQVCETCFYWLGEPGDVVARCDNERSSRYGWRMLVDDTCDEWSGRVIEEDAPAGMHTIERVDK